MTEGLMMKAFIPMDLSLARRRGLVKLALIVGFLSAAGAGWLFWSSVLPAAALSVYEVQPWGWALVILTTLCGTGALLFLADEKVGRYGGLVLLAASIFLAVAAPYLMGAMQATASDPLRHDYLTQGLHQEHRVIVLAYVAAHMLAATLSTITGISVHTWIAFYPAISKSLGLVFIAYLAGTFESVGKHERWIAAAWAAPLVSGIFEASYYPELIALHFGFFVLATAIRYEQTGEWRYGMLLLVSAMSMMMMHARMSALVLGVIIIAFGIGYMRGTTRQRLTLALLLVAFWIYWSTLLVPTGSVLSRVFTIFAGGPAFSSNYQQAAGIRITGLIRFGLVTFSGLILIGLAALPGFRGLLSRGSPASARRPMLAGALVGTFGFAGPFFIGLQAFSRAAQASLFTLLLPVYAFLGMHVMSRRTRLATAALVLVILASSVTIYRSPLMLQTSWHVDHQSYETATWLQQHGGGEYVSAGVADQLALYSYIYASTSRPIPDDPDQVLTDAEIGYSLASSPGKYAREQPFSTWLNTASGILVHERVQAMCQQSQLQEDTIEGKPFLHRRDYCRLNDLELSDLGNAPYDSGTVLLISGTPPVD